MNKLKYIFIMILVFVVGVKVSAYESYSVGDEVEYNGNKFYVIKDSDENSDTILLLLKDYVTYEELMELDIENKSQISSSGGFWYGSPSGSYEDSYIKTVVDKWEEKISFKPSHIKEARLIKYEELMDNLGYEDSIDCTGSCYNNGSLDNIPEWFKNNESCFFTMSNVNDTEFIWMISLNGAISQAPGFPCRLRPVILLYKSALTDTEPEIPDEPKQEVIEEKNETNDVVAVPNTLQKISIAFVMLGIVIVSLSIVFMAKIKANKSIK